MSFGIDRMWHTWRQKLPCGYFCFAIGLVGNIVLPIIAPFRRHHFAYNQIPYPN